MPGQILSQIASHSPTDLPLAALTSTSFAHLFKNYLLTSISAPDSSSKKAGATSVCLVPPTSGIVPGTDETLSSCWRIWTWIPWRTQASFSCRNSSQEIGNCYHIWLQHFLCLNLALKMSWFLIPHCPPFSPLDVECSVCNRPFSLFLNSPEVLGLH